MAEEKKTTTKKATTSKASTAKKSSSTTAKKTTSTTTTRKPRVKKEVIEEVKLEKKFCTNCGRELKDGEVCNCKLNEAQNNQVVSINSEAIMNTWGDIWKTILNMFKSPYTTINEELKSNDNKKPIWLFILLAISFALYMLATVTSTVNNTVSSISYGIISTQAVKIPYFKVFIYGILIYALMVLIPILATFIVAKLTRNNSYSFKKAINLYMLSNAPLILAYVGMAVVLFINISLLNILGLLAFAIVSIFCFFNFLLGFLKETTIRDDRKSYALTSVLVIWVAIEVIALLLIVGSVFSDLNYAKNNINHNYNQQNTSKFHW